MSQNHCAEQLVKEALQIASKLLQEKKGKESAVVCNQILRVEPDNLPALKLYGLAKFEQNEIEEALSIYQHALELHPDDYECHNNIALCYSTFGNYDKAIEHLLEANATNSDSKTHWANLGHQFRQKRDFKTAISHFKLALKFEETAQTYVNLAGCYGELLEFDNASKCLKRAIKISPKYSAAHMDLACVSFLTGDWETAWKEYDWRFLHYPHIKARSKFFDPKKKWRGQPIGEKEMMVLYCEQGIGDAFNFLQFVEPLRERCNYVKLLLPGDTRSLLRGQFPGVCEDQEIVDYDWHCSLMDLPKNLGMNEQDIRDNAKPFIKANKIADGVVNGPYKNHLKIGICWAGNPKHLRDRQRSCCLSNFRRIYSLPNVKLFSLQKDTRPRVWPGCEPVDLARNCQDMTGLVDFSNHMNDWDDTAGILAAMDLVITVDTSILHLAGAMGVTTFGLIPYLPDWRWGLDSDKTCWYNNVRLFRQPAMDDWESVFAEVAAAVIDLV